MGKYTDDEFGQISETETFDIALQVAETIQAFYLSGSTSKRPYGLTLRQLIDKIMKGEEIE